MNSKIVPICLSLILVLLIGCSNKTNISDSTGIYSTGKMSFAFEKQNIPSNVNQVVVYLTREGFNTFSKTLSLTSDSTAELVLDMIAIGTWHIKIEALDYNYNILYTGETDATIFENTTTNVNVILTPVENTGTLHITVTWGQLNETWLDYSGNPILSTTNQYWDVRGPNQCKIIYDEGVYKMWFGNLADDGISYVGYATSLDGNIWSRVTSSPVLQPGDGLKWDSQRSGSGPVIKENGVYKMYYHGWSDQNGLWRVGLAYSQDGVSWTKHPDPILSGTIDGEDARIVANDIIKIDNTYFLYYTYGSITNTKYKIGLATSTDGVHWNKYSGNPILTATKNWELPGVGFASVKKVGDVYKMVYANSSNSTITGFGMAISNDGINWYKEINNPFFTAFNPTIDWNTDRVLTPYYVLVGSEQRVYYTGFDSQAGYYGEYKLGYVSKN